MNLSLRQNKLVKIFSTNQLLLLNKYLQNLLLLLDGIKRIKRLMAVSVS